MTRSKKFRLLGTSIILFWVLQSCYKEPEFDMTPEISFQNIRKEIRVDQFTGANKDSVIISLGFRDGDGDLGLNESEKALAERDLNYNYIVRVFRRRSGQFVEFQPFLPYSGYFPRLRNDNRIGPIEGVLDYSIDFPHPFTPRNDTLKFEIQVKDREGNFSNKVETESIILNNLPR